MSELIFFANYNAIFDLPTAVIPVIITIFFIQKKKNWLH